MRLLNGWRSPQHRDGMALVLSSALSSAVGLLYWVIAARLFAPGTVGVNSTIVSTLTLLGSAAQLNLGSALLRFVPVAGRGARSLVVACYAVGAGFACVAGVVFGLGADWWAPELLDSVGRTGLIVFFALATPVWAVFVMQDYVLTAIKRATIVPLENLVFAILKIGLLALGAVLSVYGAIAGSWALATAVLVAGITVWLMRAIPRHTAANERAGIDRTGPPITARTITGYVSADWAGSLCSLAVNFGLQLLVLARLGPEAAATYNAAWAIAFALYLVSNGMGQSMVAHVAGDPGSLDAARRSMVTKALTLVVPAVIVIVPGAWLILSVFGEHYAATGTTLLALSAASAIPYVISASTVSAARIRQQRSVQFGVPAAIAVLVIPACWILMPLYGLTAVGIVWLVAQSLVAAGILLCRWIGARRSAAVSG
jgi:O-antigen/teichoic acid export membrane protein